MAIVRVCLRAEHPEWWPHHLRIYHRLWLGLFAASYYTLGHSNWCAGNSVATPACHPVLKDQALPLRNHRYSKHRSNDQCCPHVAASTKQQTRSAGSVLHILYLLGPLRPVNLAAHGQHLGSFQEGRNECNFLYRLLHWQYYWPSSIPTVRPTDAPDYSNGYIGLLACLVVAMVAISGHGFLCYAENRRRDRLVASSGVQDEIDDPFSDLTDKEKKSFRYVY